jgi:hypothetical protein
MRLKLICCEQFRVEMAAVISRSANLVEPEYLPRAPTPRGCQQMRHVLQVALDRVQNTPSFQAILLAYGLGSSGVQGLRSRGIPLVLPRVDHCSVLLGGNPNGCTRDRHGLGRIPQPIRRELPGEAADLLETEAEREAAWLGWDFERTRANVAMLQRFVDGFWSHGEFLVVPPGHQVAAARNEEIIRAEACTP